ncbi:MAG: response regulator [Rhodospirillaceae bacterium]
MTRGINDVLLQIRTLVADDHPKDQSTLAGYLTAIGAKRVLTASHGGEAIEILNSTPYPVDLIVADIRMPGLNGLQLLKAVRTGAIKGLRLNATVVLATAYPEVGVIQAASELDANGFLAKPVKLEKFEAAILKARRTIFPPNPRHENVFVPEKL